MINTLNPIATAIQEDAADSKIGASAHRWRTLTRLATMMCEGGQLTAEYNSVGKMLMALDYADRLNLAIVNVIQNFAINEQGAYWKGAGMIALVNSSNIYDGRLRFEESGQPVDIDYKVRAYAKCKDGTSEYGPWIDKTMGKLANWDTTFEEAAPEIALKYRSANFFVRLNCPEISQGIVGDVDQPSAGISQGGSQAHPAANSAAANAIADAVALGQQTSAQTFKVGAAFVPDAPPGASAKAPAAFEQPNAAAAAPKRAYVKKTVTTGVPTGEGNGAAGPAQGAGTIGATAPASAPGDQADLLGGSESANPASPQSGLSAQTLPPAIPPAAAALADTQKMDLDVFDVVIGNDIDPDPAKIAACFVALESVSPESRADCEALLAIRLATMLARFTQPNAQATAAFHAVHSATLSPGAAPITGVARQDLGNAYLLSARKLWPAA